MAAHLPVLANSKFSLEYKNPCLTFTDVTDERKEYHVGSSSLVRDMDKPFLEYQKEIELEITKYPVDTLLIVFPEYCWRTTPPKEVFEYIEELKNKISSKLTLVLGTLEFVLNGKYTNNAIIISNKNMWFVPKTKVLEGELKQQMVAGTNPGVIQLQYFRLGVLVCADLWEAPLVYDLVINQKADILAVPSWTATRQGNRIWAKLDFITLAKSRSLEFSVPIIVSDHSINRPTTDVGNALIIADPSKRQNSLPLDENIERLIHKIASEDVIHARNRWKQKGLAPL